MNCVVNEIGGYVRVAFLGLGKMGWALVPHLLNGDHDVTVWNRNAAIGEKFVPQGAEAAFDTARSPSKRPSGIGINRSDRCLSTVSTAPSSRIRNAEIYA